MPPLNVFVSWRSRRTGRLLNELLREQGIDTRCVFLERNGNSVSPTRFSGTPAIFYGPYIRRTGTNDTTQTVSRTINGGGTYVSKLSQALRLCQVMPSSTMRVHIPSQLASTGITSHPRTPLFGRSRYHRGGTDIVPVLGPSEIHDRIRAGVDYFTEYVDTIKEYRVWVYRGRHLGSYEKVLTRPHEYRGIGRNYGNGFSFELVREGDIDRDVVGAAGIAVDALGLDFGGVDVGVRPDGTPVVFEVNRAPGVEGGTRQVIRAFARKIKNWLQNGCPARARSAQDFDGRDLESAFSAAIAA